MKRNPVASLALVYTTVAKRTDAVKLSEALLDARLIACANIVGPTQALYRWKGQKKRETEYLVFMKTLLSHALPMKKKIEKVHPYECPCILTIPVQDANPEFVRWCEGEVK